MLFVLRPLEGGFTPSTVGEEFAIEDTEDKVLMMRARQMYEQRRVGTLEELELMLAKDARLDPELRLALELSRSESFMFENEGV